MAIVSPDLHAFVIDTVQPARILPIALAVVFCLVPVQRAVALINVGALDAPGMAFDVEVVGGLVYVSDWDSGLRIVEFGPKYPTYPCDDRLDNDFDSWVDYPDDPGCRDPLWSREAPQCQDGINNDPGKNPNPGLVDLDGGLSIFGAGDPRVTDPDPQCIGKPWKNREAKAVDTCGLGADPALLLPPLLWL